MYFGVHGWCWIWLALVGDFVLCVCGEFSFCGFLFVDLVMMLLSGAIWAS